MADLYRLDIEEPDSLPDDTPLAGGAFDLDSLDRLELALCIEEEFGVAIRSEWESRVGIRSLSGVADFIRAHAVAREGCHVPVALARRLAT